MQRVETAAEGDLDLRGFLASTVRAQGLSSHKRHGDADDERRRCDGGVNSRARPTRTARRARRSPKPFPDGRKA